MTELSIRFVFPFKQLLMKKTINTYDRGKCYYVQLRKMVSLRESCSQAETQNNSTNTKVEVYRGGQIYTFPPGGSVSFRPCDFNFSLLELFIKGTQSIQRLWDQHRIEKVIWGASISTIHGGLFLFPLGLDGSFEQWTASPTNSDVKVWHFNTAPL